MNIQAIQQAVDFLRSRVQTVPETGIILGTGLSGMANMVEAEASISYDEIPHFVRATVETHTGKLIFGTIHGKKLVMMQGRFHFYEGYTLEQVTFPVRVMKMLGIKRLLVSNACGGLNPLFGPASLMLLDDHINFLPGNPLVGPNLDAFGPRFPDMSRPYNLEMNSILKQIAQEHNIVLHEGVYAAWLGPSLETRAEYRFLKMAGADVVGMSTVPEVIVANHMKLPVSAISVVTDLCDPDNLAPINIDDILANAAKAEKQLLVLFGELISRFD